MTKDGRSSVFIPQTSCCYSVQYQDILQGDSFTVLLHGLFEAPHFIFWPASLFRLHILFFPCFRHHFPEVCLSGGPAQYERVVRL